MAAKKAKLKPLNICLVTAELAPFAKTGGLADVSVALSEYLCGTGHDVRVLMPRYSRVDNEAGEIKPVEGLQDLVMQVGGRQYRYSIDITTVPGGKLPVYLLRCPNLYDRDGIYTQDDDEYVRFIVLTRAAIEMCQHMGFAPDIFHCHDWHTALGPLYLKSRYAWDRLFENTHSVLTIHNIGYQGMFPASITGDIGLDDAEQYLHREDLSLGRVNFLKTGILYADLVTTVSPTYAREIQGGDYGMGLDHLLRERSGSVIGILNGVDYKEWNPETDTLIPHNFSASDLGGKMECKLGLMQELGLEPVAERPLVGIVTRLAAQKGIDLIEKVIPHLLSQRNFALAVLGSGEPRFEEFFTWLQNQFPGRACFYRGYSNRLAHWIEAGSDLFLMPSVYEPCGLNQMYSLRYGTVPIVRHTGGLADSVEAVDPEQGTGTGIVFKDYDSNGLAWAINAGLDMYQDSGLWQKIIANGMAQNFSWEQQGGQYVNLYRQLRGAS